jgi:hypothetical protein
VEAEEKKQQQKEKEKGPVSMKVMTDESQSQRTDPEEHHAIAVAQSGRPCAATVANERFQPVRPNRHPVAVGPCY